MSGGTEQNGSLVFKTPLHGMDKGKLKTNWLTKGNYNMANEGWVLVQEDGSSPCFFDKKETKKQWKCAHRVLLLGMNAKMGTILNTCPTKAQLEMCQCLIMYFLMSLEHSAAVEPKMVQDIILSFSGLSF